MRSRTLWARWQPLVSEFFRFYGELGWTYPLKVETSREISSGYKVPSRPTHQGIDIVSSIAPNVIKGDIVYAIHDGTVITSGRIGGGGNSVVIRSDVIDPSTNRRIVSRYMHMDWGNYQPRPLDNEGNPNRIEMGTPIGLVSDTGSPGQIHLHLDFNNMDLNTPGHAAYFPHTINPQRFFPNIEFTQIRFSGQLSDVMP